MGFAAGREQQHQRRERAQRRRRRGTRRASRTGRASAAPRRARRRCRACRRRCAPNRPGSCAPARRGATAAHSPPGDRRCCRGRSRPNTATSTQYEFTTAATAKPTAPSSRPAISASRALMRSIRKPAGVCATADTALNIGQRETDLGVAHRIVRPHEGEQRRQHQHVEMADEMRGADARDQADVVGRGEKVRWWLRSCFARPTFTSCRLRRDPRLLHEASVDGSGHARHDGQLVTASSARPGSPARPATGSPACRCA